MDEMKRTEELTPQAAAKCCKKHMTKTEYAEMLRALRNHQDAFWGLLRKEWKPGILLEREVAEWIGSIAKRVLAS